MAIFATVREYIEPFAEVLSDDLVHGRHTRRSSRRSVETYRERFVWEFLAEVLRSSGLFLLVLIAILALERSPISSVADAFRLPDSVGFLARQR